MLKVKEDVQAVIYVMGPEGPSFLLIERFDRPTGQFHWRLVKGTVRKGEKREKALVREIGEEVGLTRIRVKCFLTAYSYEHAGVRHEVASYLVEADPSEPVRLASSDDGRPLRSYRWARPEEALALLRWKEERRVLKLAVEKLMASSKEEGC